MSKNFGHCPLCGGDKQPGTMTFAIDLKFGVVVVREVPAFVCTQCGDAWFADHLAAKLENVVADARGQTLAVRRAARPHDRPLRRPRSSGYTGKRNNAASGSD